MIELWLTFGVERGGVFLPLWGIPFAVATRHLDSGRSMWSRTAERSPKNYKKPDESFMSLHWASLLGTLICSDNRHSRGWPCHVS